MFTTNLLTNVLHCLILNNAFVAAVPLISFIVYKGWYSIVRSKAYLCCFGVINVRKKSDN